MVHVVIFVVKVMMSFVSIGLLCFGLFVLCGSKVSVSVFIPLVAGIRALCPVLLLMGWRRVRIRRNNCCYCSCNMVVMIVCSLLTVDIVDSNIDCIDPAVWAISQSTTCTSSTPYSPLFPFTFINLISSPLISGLDFILYLL